MRAIIRVTVPSIQDDEAVKLRQQIEQLVSKQAGSTVELQLMAPFGGTMPPPPPPPVL
jgi:hypothetical protein